MSYKHFEVGFDPLWAYMDNLLLIIGQVAYVVRLLWITSAIMLELNSSKRLFNKTNLPYKYFLVMFAELKPFYLPAIMFMMAKEIGTHTTNWFSPIDYACAIILYHLLKNVDEDDRWKKRRKKLTEKVKAFGGRLVVVPTS